MENIRACSFTGHRHIKEKHKSKINSLVMRSIEYAYSRGCRTFYTGGALGFDTVAARQVILFKLAHPDVRLIILIPCKEQEASWKESDRDAYDYILSRADESEILSDDYTNDCMKERNTALCERADMIVAYLYKEYSGAGQTVRIAKKLQKEVYNIYPALEEESEKNKTAPKAQTEGK